MDAIEVIEKWFGESTVKYFHGSDRLHSEEGDTYIRVQSRGKYFEIWIGGSNSEMMIFYSSDGDSIDQLISLLIHGYISNNQT